MMKARVSISFLLLGTMLGMLAGCASQPISKNLRRQAKPLTLDEVTAEPTAYKGTTVVWGGTIVKAANGTNDSSIEVLQLPLDSQERPWSHAFARGYFIAHLHRPVDPSVFKKGTLITVAGTVLGVESQTPRDIEPTCPAVGVEQLCLWHRKPLPSSEWGWAWDEPAWDWYGPPSGWGTDGHWQ